MTTVFDGGVAIGWKATNPTLRVEVLRAPDDGAGGPDTANEISLAIVNPPVSGFVDTSAGVSLTRFHYRVRHIFPGYNPGTASKFIRGHGVAFNTQGVVLPITSNSLSTSQQAPNAQWIQAGGTIFTPYFTPAQHALFAALSLTTAPSGTSAAIYGEAAMNTATTQNIIGTMGLMSASHTSGTMLLIKGLVGIVAVTGAGGTTTHARSIAAEANLANGTVTNYSGFYWSAPGTGATVTNAYGVYVEAVTLATNNYAIYTNAGRTVFNAGAAANSQVWIGHTTAATGSPQLDIVGAGTDATTAVILADVTTNATNKRGTFGVRHYTNSEEPVLGIHVLPANTTNQVLIGGGISAFNAATEVSVYTAANTTTVTGTEAARFNNTTTAGNVRFMIFDVDNNLLEQVSVGAADSGGAGFKVLRIAN